ncbi:hypothetical protein AS361_05195 [Myroides marinus]|uniref:hypothetical protein n=1 Tax=Myroides marinus TaxID=703342 RepID=UPI000741C95C|nr:hypothetical protein [Myroides marinus]KUF38634.1 hypothetical protein AS361_05195 [Myroides marinus]
MALNLLKIYNTHLELSHFTEAQRTNSLRGIFDRDIANNEKFQFRTKIIRPLKKEGEIDMETLFSHLTKKSEEVTDENGVKIKARNIFDNDRSKRLHWIWHHIQEIKENLHVFSCEERKGGKNVIHTYIFDAEENYVIVLEPQRSKQDYYLLSAYYLNEEWARKSMRKKWKKRLQEVY